ncbi:MAG: hypothetical protein AUG51_07785 [Acidobacteria bacterium 13_1_20CM_3_53_8]|nr:MAG: hypothetical protein AUG51_07785 [Acidobacteria bacterium 13_1_20CM_3_53_8]
MRRADILREARKLLGVPFKLEGRNPTTGLDCAGLVICVAQAFGCFRGLDYRPHSSPSTSGAFPAAVQRETQRIPAASAKPGDILYLSFKGMRAAHVAIVSALSPLRVIHAGDMTEKVIEAPLNARLKQFIVCAYQFRGLKD